MAHYEIQWGDSQTDTAESLAEAARRAGHDGNAWLYHVSDDGVSTYEGTGPGVYADLGLDEED